MRSLKAVVAVAAALLATGCASSGPTGPSQATGLSESVVRTGRTVNTVDRSTDVLDGIAAGCVTEPIALSWLIAGQNDPIIATAHSDTANCNPTKENPRNPGLATIAAEGPNQRIAYPANAYSQWTDHPCGRIQVDIEDRATGVLLVGMMINYGVDCAPPPPAPPVTPPPVVTPPPPAPPVTPPPPTSCELAEPSFSVVFPTGGVGGSATVRNAGAWSLTLYAATSLEKYRSDSPDWLKARHQTTMTCLESSTLSVSYPWDGHPATYWWVVLTGDGEVVYKSDAVLRP